MFTWRNVSTYPDTSIAHYYAQLADFNDQTGEYLAGDVDSLCTAWDNLGGRWDIVQVDSATIANAWVLIKSLNPVYASPFGIGFVSLETSGTGLSLTAPDNSTGISPQLQSRIESHNMILIDGILTGIIGDSITSFFADADAGALQEVQTGDTLRVLGGYGVNTTIAGDTITVTADTTQLATLSDVANAGFVADADSGTPQTINSGDTLQINSGWGVNTTVGATGVVTVTGDSTQVATQHDISTHVAGPLTAGRIPRATGTYTLSDGVLRDDGSILAIGGATVSGYSLYDYGTGGWRLPTGTTAQQPTNIAGVHRYNTSLGYSETANGSAWLQSDFPEGTGNYTIRHNGTSWVSNSLLQSSSSLIWINNATGPPNSQTFGVAGNVIIGSAQGHYLQIGGENGALGYTFNNTSTNGVGRFTVSGGFLAYSGSVFSFTNSARFSGANLFLRFSSGQVLQSVNQRQGAVIGEINTEGTRIFQWNFAEAALANANGNLTPFYVGLPARYYRASIGNQNGTIIGALFRQSITADSSSVTPTLIAMAIEPAFSNNGLTNVNKHGIRYRATTTGTHYAATFNSGLVGIGTETPARLLHVEGEARVTDLTTDTPTRIVGADADGDLGAVSEGYGVNITGGALEVDTTQIATQSDLASISPTTLYTGDGTIATDRTVTIGSDKTLTISGTTPDLPGYSFTEKKGYSSTWDTWGYYRLIYTDSFYTNFIQGILNYDSSVFVRISAGDWAGDYFASLYMNEAGQLSLTGIDDSGTSAGMNFADNATLGGGYGARLAGGAGIEFDTETGGKFVYQVNNSTKATLDGTGLGINDTSPEKSLDVGGMGKFRQLSGQDNSVTIGTNANAGTGRSASITDAQSSDVAGRFSFTSGTTLTAGEWVTLTWGTAFDNPPAVVLMPENANGASLVPYLYVVPSTTGCSIVVNVTGVPYEGLTYEFNYIVIQGK